jgi:hypothetical protein
LLLTEQDTAAVKKEQSPFQDAYNLDNELDIKKERIAEAGNMLSFLYDIGLEDEIILMNMVEKEKNQDAEKLKVKKNEEG